MDQGWVARFSSPGTGASVQVVTRDATAPEDSALTVKVEDVDAAHAECVRRGWEIVHPVTDEPWGSDASSCARPTAGSSTWPSIGRESPDGCAAPLGVC